MSLSIFYWNCAAGLLRKIDYIREFLIGNKVDIFFVSEAEYGVDNDRSLLDVNGYELVFSKTLISRNKARLLCYKKPQFAELDIFVDTNEILGFRLKNKQIVALYRGFKLFEGETESSNWSRIITDLDKLDYKKEIIIIGDFNIDITKPYARFQNELREWTFAKGLSIIDAGITRVRLVNENLQQSCIDFALTNMNNITMEREFNDMSDHCVLKARLSVFDHEARKSQKKEITLTNWNFDLDKARNFLDTQLKSLPAMFVNVEEHNYQIMACILRTLREYVKFRVVKLRGDRDVTSPLIIKLKNHRNKLRKKWSQARNAENYVEMIRATRKLRLEVYNTRKRLIKSKMSKGTREFWGEIKTMMGSKGKTLDKVTHGGSEVTDKDKMANLFVEEFTSKVNNLLGDYHPTKISEENNAFEPLTNQEILKAFKRLSNKKSSGMDNVSGYFIKQFASILAPFLTNLFNAILTDKHVPEIWKIAKISPVFKKGCPDDIKNYRPVSNLNSIAKIFELCLLGRFEQLDFDNLMSPFQHGFRKLHSTESALTELVSNISESLDEKECVCVYSADLTAAFDVLQREKLIPILKQRKVPGYLINAVNAYLTDRMGFVQIDNHRSIVRTIRAGCVQGSIIGPLLFNILTSDLSKVIFPNKVVSYADDSYIVIKTTKAEDLKPKVTECMEKHFEWLNSIGMICNQNKTEMMVFGIDELSLELGNMKIQSTNKMKALGVILDNKLSWEEHVSNIIRKSRSLQFAFRYLRRFLEIDELRSVLNAHLISRISYAAPVWSHSLNIKYKLRLRSTYYNTLRVLIRDFNKRISRPTLLDKFKMEDIIAILEKRTSVFIFKLVYHLQPFNIIQRLLSKSYLNERNPDKVIFFDTSKTRIGKMCITNAAKKITESWEFNWLSLSIEEFKSKLKAQFLRSD